jgi:hypothetical protein
MTTKIIANIDQNCQNSRGIPFFQRSLVLAAEYTESEETLNIFLKKGMCFETVWDVTRIIHRWINYSPERSFVIGRTKSHSIAS